MQGNPFHACCLVIILYWELLCNKPQSLVRNWQRVQKMGSEGASKRQYNSRLPCCYCSCDCDCNLTHGDRHNCQGTICGCGSAGGV